MALAEVRAGAVETSGEIAPDDPLLGDAEARLLEPLSVHGRFGGAGEGKYYWRASFATRVRLECRRCLEPVEMPVEQSVGLVFSSASDVTEGDGAYVVPPRTQVLDLRDALREEVLLALPRFAECRSDCLGLCPRCGANLNEGPCGCPPPADTQWDALRALTRPEKD